ncbi:hypothetical protein JHK85_011592 [Glycine max]|nr:hypothetical protein JHK85_011592 [Glycine max]KHN47016.1 hypothetical protein glysoja_018383 [Glycine soja]
MRIQRECTFVTHVYLPSTVQFLLQKVKSHANTMDAVGPTLPSKTSVVSSDLHTRAP